MNAVEEKKRRRSMIEEVLDLCVDNSLITHTQVATLLNIPIPTVKAIRASDSFNTILTRRVEARYGTALRAVRTNTLVAANEALETAKIIMNDPAQIASMKLEAAKVALESYHKSEERSVPKGPVGTPGQTNVAINLTFAELTDAQERSRQYGRDLKLEASDVTHAPQISDQSRQILPGGERSRSPIRSQS